MANNPDYVTAVAPASGGSVFVAPKGTTLPTDAVTDLSDAFVGLGHISENGISNDYDKSTDSAKDWNGDAVCDLDSGVTNTYKIEFMETLNPEVIKLKVGDSNVTGDFESGMSWSDKGNDMTERVWVMQKLVKGGVERTILPRGVITAIDTTTHIKNGVRVLGATITAYVDTNGHSFYSYAKKSA